MSEKKRATIFAFLNRSENRVVLPRGRPAGAYTKCGRCKKKKRPLWQFKHCRSCQRLNAPTPDAKEQQSTIVLLDAETLRGLLRPRWRVVMTQFELATFSRQGGDGAWLWEVGDAEEEDEEEEEEEEEEEDG